MNTNLSADLNWKTELDKTALRYHTITLWVAVVFNLLFFVTDYINVYEYWQEFLTFRVVVAFVCLITVLFHKKLISNSDKETEEQKRQLEILFGNWKGKLEQIDDVCIVGVRI